MVHEVHNHIEHQDGFLQLLKDKLSITNNKMKQQVDQHHSERKFEVGYWVYLRLQPYT